MEGDAANMPHKNGKREGYALHKRRREANFTIARIKKTFLRTCYPQRTSSGQPIDGTNPAAQAVVIDIQDAERPPYIKESLYEAALSGDWPSANDLYKKYPGELPPEMGAPTLWELPITQLEQMNTLQVAVAVKQTTFVKELLDCMSTPGQLAFENANGDTALAIAALSGNVIIAKKMVEKNNRLPMIRNKNGHLPLLTAATHGHRDMVLYLYHGTKFDELKDDERIKLLLDVISCDLFDLADEIMINDPTLATAKDENDRTALEELARNPFVIGSTSQKSVLERCIGSCFKGVYHRALMRQVAHDLVVDIWKKVRKLPMDQYSKYSKTIFVAAELGNVEFLAILIRTDPDLIWMVDENKRNIFHISILFRQESIFNLIYEIGVFKEIIATRCDKDGNNMLHLAGKLPELTITSGAAIFMQHELLWFKEIEKIVPLKYVKAKNLEQKTPKDLFRETHKDLHINGEKWMRETATHCMLVATLIVTVVFAAAFTIPGGNNQGNGTPIFLEHNWFVIFFISDSIALLSSSTSILIFLSILTSRYTERDFLSSLPRRLMFGLTTLFISIVSMIVAFAATCFLVYQHKMTRIPTVIIALASVPIFTFLMLHYELFSDIISSTFLPKFIFQSRKRRYFKKVEDVRSNN